MANLKQSKKRILQDRKKRILNKGRLSAVRTYIKSFLKLLISKNIDLAVKRFSIVVSKIDKCVTKKIFKKKKADRLKSRLNYKLKLFKIKIEKGM